MAVYEQLARLRHAGATAGEQRALTILVEQPRVAIFLTAAEVGARAGVHESTVVRLAQKLGYSGYSELRAKLREEYDVTPFLARAREREAKTHELSSYVADEAAALMRIAESISQDELDAAARTLLDAEMVYVYGIDTLTTTLARRLRRLGLRVVELEGGPRTHAERLVSFGPRDAIVAFAMSDASASLLDAILRHVNQVGGASILVTDYRVEPMRHKATHEFHLVRGADPAYRTLTAPTALSYAFELAVFHLDPTRGARALSTFDELAVLFGTGSPPSEPDTERLTSRVSADNGPDVDAG